MKANIIRFILFTQCVCTSFAQDVQFRLLTANETAEVKQKLDSFEKGTATLDTLTDGPESMKKILEYYSLHKYEVTTKMKLPISKSYAGWGKYPEAAELAQEYVNVYSNDWRGWSMLGGAKLLMKSYDESVNALTNAIRLGDTKNLAALGMAAIAANRMGILRDTVVPKMLDLKDSEQISKEKKLEMISVLVVYALREEKKDVFLRALKNVEARDILSKKDLAYFAHKGCEQFKGADIDKIRKELEAASESSSNSAATNAPSTQH